MAQRSRTAAPTTTTTAPSTPSSSPIANGVRTSSPTHLLLTLLILSTLLTLATPISFEHIFKNNRNRPPNDCQIDMHVSAICFQCAALHPSRFYDIHDPCCESNGRVRELCRAWYTEEPKRGRRDVWYY